MNEDLTLSQRNRVVFKLEKKTQDGDHLVILQQNGPTDGRCGRT
jgi:hypothetical protein